MCGIFLSFYYRFWIIKLLIFVWPCKWFARSLQGEPGRTFSGRDRQSNPPLGHTALQACREREKPQRERETTDQEQVCLGYEKVGELEINQQTMAVFG